MDHRLETKRKGRMRENDEISHINFAFLEERGTLSFPFAPVLRVNPRRPRCESLSFFFNFTHPTLKWDYSVGVLYDRFIQQYVLIAYQLACAIPPVERNSRNSKPTQSPHKINKSSERIMSHRGIEK